MKKNQILSGLAFGLAAVLYSCAPSGSQKTASETDTLTVATVVRHIADSTGTYEIRVGFPNAKPGSALAVAVGEWVSEQLGGTYGTADSVDYAQLLADTAALANHYFDEVVSRNQKDYAELMGANPEISNLDIAYYDSLSIEKLGEGRSWVTFINKHEIYSGGAHGSFLCFGQTFRKSDGRRIGWDIFANTTDEGFQKLLKEGLMEYWELKKETDLENFLMGTASVYYIPLPQCPPLFTEKGVEFVYNQYEIAAYAAGLPSFTVGYDKLEPYMMSTAKRMVKE